MLADISWADYLWKVPPLLIVFLGVLLIVPILVYLERKVSAMIQDRTGPNRVGLLGPGGFSEVLTGHQFTKNRFLGGLLQPLADVIKLLTKEDILPHRADAF